MYSTSNRMLNVNLPGFRDTLLLTEIKGKEQLSQPFDYTLTLLSDNLTLQPKQMVCKPISMSISNAEGVQQLYSV